MAQVKRNQPSLFNGISEEIVNQKPLDSFEEHEKDHGRQTSWYVSVFNARQHEKSLEWPNLSRFIHVHRVCTKKGKTVHSNRLYMTDLWKVDAALFHKGIREHWGIENRLHWVKDVIHKEDKNRIRTGNGPVNMATMSTIAINIHRKNGHDSITEGQIKFGANVPELFDLLRT